MGDWRANENDDGGSREPLGSVLALATPDCEIVESYEYEPYGMPTIYDDEGEIVASRTSTVGNRFMFTGREWDELGEFYHYRHRTYSPHEKRFMQRDPIGLAGGWNVYAYCGGDPVNWNDPMGLSAKELMNTFSNIDLYSYLEGNLSRASRMKNIHGLILYQWHASALAVLDAVGAPTVRRTAELSGSAAGCGDTKGAWFWGGATGGLILAEALSFGKGNPLANFSKWASNPVLYELGSVTTSKAVFNPTITMTAIERGRYYKWTYCGGSCAKAQKIVSAEASVSDFLVTIQDGLTPGGVLGVVLTNSILNGLSRRRQVDGP